MKITSAIPASSKLQRAFNIPVYRRAKQPLKQAALYHCCCCEEMLLFCSIQLPNIIFSLSIEEGPSKRGYRFSIRYKSRLIEAYFCQKGIRISLIWEVLILFGKWGTKDRGNAWANAAYSFRSIFIYNSICSLFFLYLFGIQLKTPYRLLRFKIVL